MAEKNIDGEMMLDGSIEVKDGLVEEEAKELRNSFNLPYGTALLYLKYINQKGLIKDFSEWREKQIMEVL
jgi:hypothetical protein